MGHPVVLNNNVLLENSHFTLIIVIRRNVSTKCPSKIKQGTYKYNLLFFPFIAHLCFLKNATLIFLSKQDVQTFHLSPQEVFHTNSRKIDESYEVFFLEKLTFPQNRSIILLFDFTNKRMTTYFKLYVINVHYVQYFYLHTYNT